MNTKAASEETREYCVTHHCSEAKYDIYVLRFIGIEQVALPSSGGTHDLLLKQRETYWIHTDIYSGNSENGALLLNVML